MPQGIVAGTCEISCRDIMKPRNRTMNMMKTIFVCAVLSVVAGCRYAPDTPCMVPKNAERLDELALFSGETEADATFNEAERKANPEGPRLCRNSLFIRWREADGTDEWRLLLTTGTAWREADGMNEWCKGRAREIRECFMVLNASLSNDGRSIWLVCNPHSFTYNVVSKFDLRTNTFRVIGDGDSAEEQPDGTILVRNKKSYRNGKNGEPLGAVWYDEWIAPDGTVVRKTEPKQLNN